MAKDLASIEKAARALSPLERARLVRRLIASLDEGDDTDAEQAWLDEAERRYDAYRRGAMQARSVEEVLRELDNELK